MYTGSQNRELVKGVDLLREIEGVEVDYYILSAGFGLLMENKKIPPYDLRNQEDFEIRNFINNERSILEIRNAASAEFRPIPLKDVENYIKLLEIGRMITIEKKSK